MNDETLFLRTLDDIHKSIHSNDEYEVLRASALIRQLFLDGGVSLFDRVNRTHRLKIAFEIAENDNSLKAILPEVYIHARFAELDPQSCPQHWTRKKLKRDDFFAFKVATVEQHEYSIKELIIYAAHIMGGVHSGDSQDDKQKNLEKLRGLYLFSNINTALLFIKSVGGNILKTLTPLRLKILGIDRFENAKGLSFFFGIILFPLLNKENYILDLGIEENRNRLSIFLNSNGELCLRFLESSGRRYLLNAGSSGLAFSYGQRTVLFFHLGFNEKELFLSVNSKDWQYIEIQPFNSNEFSENVFDNLHFVLGSDVFGKAETKMQIVEWGIFSRILTSEEQNEIGEYLITGLSPKKIKCISFEGNQFLHSNTHPNFTKT